LRFARRHSRLLLFALLFALLATSLGWTTSFFLRALIDRILPNREIGLLMALGAGLVLISGVQALLQFGRLWLLARVGHEISRTYSARYIDQLLALPMKVFDARCLAGLVLRLNQVELVQQAAGEMLVTLVADGIMFLAALAVMLSFDPFAALIALSAMPLMLGVIVVLNERVYNSQLAVMIRSEEFNANMLDTFDGLRAIKTFSAEERYRQLLAGKLEALVQARYTNRMAMTLPTTWSMLTTALVSAGVLWYGSARVLAGQLTAGDLIVLFGMVAFYLNPVQRLPNLVLTIRGALIGIMRMEEIMVLPQEHERTTEPVSLPALGGRIEFDQVSFGYKPRRPVLKQLNFTIEPGEAVAIVGETGSGKTSLANLIAGFYLPSEGDVRIDGISTRNIHPEELRRSISAVFQGTRLFQHSVRENITMLADAPSAAVEQAARLANAAPFINDLLRGYDTQVARGGDNFSSGQAQRIALARALLKDAPILILDEATSNLDGATEQGILQALEQHRHGRTTLIIAHRLSTVLSADRIFVMDDGEIVESGTHAELLARRGRYYSLFRWQVIGDETPVAQQESTLIS
jgi:ABC-type bacteriocin/lantibiotic exporter with double-glycine peptidase domain